MKQFYVCTSKIEGFGLRSGEKVKKGELIFTFKGVPKFKVNKSKRDALAHPNWVGVDENQWIDPEKPFKFMNHSCNPNATIMGSLSVVALRNIKEGEELTFDYSVTESDSRWEMSCNCGEKNCRKIISSVSTIPKKQLNRYLPFSNKVIKNYLANIAR
jgi:uncharacterized protein